jgi:2-polyprenyl-6-hydroxyphenyl methylase/3-demethylubiquinone-9 3-methyltransferase
VPSRRLSLAGLRRRWRERRLAVTVRPYYERYWAAESPVPTDDPTTEERWSLLSATLARHAAAGARVLDLGCGEGPFVRMLSGAGYRAAGCDIAQGALTRAGKGAYARIGDTLALPFRDSAFDAVWCTEVIEHVMEPLRLLSEASRVVKPGGVVVTTTPYHGLLKNIAIALLAFDGHYDPEGPHIRFFTPRSLEALAARAGLEVVERARIGRIPPLAKSMYHAFRRRS